jgi:hypothetical protein
MSSNAIHGKGAIVYASPGTGAAQPLAEQVDWALDYEQPLVEVTPLNNTWKNFVKGLAGWTMACSGNFDPVGNILWSASIATGKSNIYLYPLGAADMTRYYYGTGWIVLGKIAAGSTSAKASSSFKATGDDALSVR